MVEARLGDLEDELAEQDKTVPGRDDGVWVSLGIHIPYIPYISLFNGDNPDLLRISFWMFFDVFSDFSDFWKTKNRHDMKDHWIFGGFHVFFVWECFWRPFGI